MSEFLRRIFSPEGFMPHGHCYLWQRDLIWLHVVSDALVALAYASIPIFLVEFVRRRRDVPFRAVFVLFGIFIVSCGLTHVLEIVTLWTPLYWLSGITKAFTAFASVSTAIFLVRLFPLALKLPSPAAHDQALAETRVAQLRVRAAFDAMADGFALVEPIRAEDGSVTDFVVRDVNRVGAARFGVAPEELVGREMKSYLEPETWEKVTVGIFDAERRGEPSERDIHFEYPDGKALWVHQEVRPLQVGFALVSRDITKERTHRELLELHSAVVAGIGEGVAMIRAKDEVILSTNARCAEIFGYLPGELDGAKSAILRADGDGPRGGATTNARREAFDRTGRTTFESKNRKKDGTTIHCRATVSAIEHPSHGKVYVALLDDITENKRNEEEIRRLAAIVESTSEAVIGVSLDGVIESWNQGAERLFGYGREDVTEQALGTIWQGEEEVRGRLERISRGEAVAPFETTSPRRGGDRVEIAVTISPVLSADGAVRAASLIVHDIGARKQAERAAAASLQEKDTLLREIHHRVKNNLQVVSSLVSLQSSRLGDPALRAALSDLQGRVRSIALLHEMLYQDRNVASVAFERYVKELGRSALRAAGGRAASVELSISAPDVRLRLDEAVPCALIINELVTNALKHAWPPSHVGPMQVRVTMTGGDGASVHLHVEDNGTGFEPAPDAPPSLGLHLVNMLTKQLGGTVALSRAKGTRCDIEFRRTFGHAPPPEGESKGALP